MKPTKAPQIPPDCTNIPPGWPRAYYVSPVDNKIKYTQWTSGKASEQIMLCSTERTTLAAQKFACSSCAYVMVKGLLIADVHPYDGQVGSPICFRCAVFAYKHCPEFVKNADKWQWHVVTDSTSYAFIDESHCLEVSSGTKSTERITKEVVFAEVAANRLWLTDINIGVTT